MAIRTALSDLLDIEHPILLAGMGVWGMATPPALVAAVSEAGGLGVLGCSGLSPEEIRRRIKAVRALTDKPFGVDLLLPATLAPAATTRSGVRAELGERFPAHVAFYRNLLTRFELAEAPVQDDIVISSEFIEAQIAVTLEEHVSVFAAGLGDPGRVTGRAKAQGMVTLGLAGSPRNAARQVEAGVDAVVAQGTEAGGHTGRVANFALIPQVVDAVGTTPVIAAGGISDGRGIAASMALGASGAWLGSLFLTADESDMPGACKDELIASRSTDMDVTRAWTGKTLRARKNEVSAAWSKSGLDPLPTPHQRVLMEDFLEAVKAAKRWDLFMNAAGQGIGMVSKRKSAAEIMADLIEGMERAIDELAARTGR
jgi:NAD(P)H-dependent flavin oxidoreductase YrpB (nitropropane dioxygenase family)